MPNAQYNSAIAIRFPATGILSKRSVELFLNGVKFSGNLLYLSLMRW